MTVNFVFALRVKIGAFFSSHTGISSTARRPTRTIDYLHSDSTHLTPLANRNITSELYTLLWGT